MKPQPKFGKRPSPQRDKLAADLAEAQATVREWMGPNADAATLNRFAAQLARRA